MLSVMHKKMNEKTRFFDGREHRFTISVPTDDDPTLVVCPKCKKMAKVFLTQKQPELGDSVKVICSSCGYTKEKEATERSCDWYGEDPTDSYFGYSLWLKIACCGHSLWAFNIRHLDLLQNYVIAELRERKQDEYGYSNSSIASRLPSWIKSAKNRKELTQAISKLRQSINA